MGELLRFDSEESASALERTYATPDVERQRRALLRALALAPGEAVLDIGCGPGFVLREMAATVGSAGRAVGLDISGNTLEMARERCREYSWAELCRAEAVRLPFADAAFDAAVATQVYEFVADLDSAFAELRRVLRSGGRAAIIDTDWHTLAFHTADRARMRRVLEAWDEHVTDPELPRKLDARLQRFGLSVREHSIIPLINTRYDRNTYSYGLVPLIRSYAAGRQGITQQEAEEWAAEQRALGQEGAYFFSLNRHLIIAEKT
jgi:arsenite methyltransferase